MLICNNVEFCATYFVAGCRSRQRQNRGRLGRLVNVVLSNFSPEALGWSGATSRPTPVGTYQRAAMPCAINWHKERLVICASGLGSVPWRVNAHVPLAIKILVLGGIGNVVLSFVLGWVLSAKRMKGPMEPHRWLLIAHEVSLQEGMLLLGLGFATMFAELSPNTATLGASLLVAASVFQDFSGIVNWLRRTGDQFAERSSGWMLASVNAVLNTAGVAIIAYGVIRGLL